MTGLRERAAEGLQAGDRFRTYRTFTKEEVTRFARISKDYNPVHFDARFAASRNFREPICHGLLSAGLMTEIGGQIGWLASAINFRFKGPVYVGDTITCDWIITEIDEKGRARASFTMTNEDGGMVIEGEISGIVPGPEARTVLRRMLLEGDPTNGPTHTRMTSG